MSTNDKALPGTESTKSTVSIPSAAQKVSAKLRHYRAVTVGTGTCSLSLLVLAMLGWVIPLPEIQPHLIFAAAVALAAVAITLSRVTAWVGTLPIVDADTIATQAQIRLYDAVAAEVQQLITKERTVPSISSNGSKELTA